MSAFVVVSGLPASGKTTIAAKVARQLGFPHLDKDTLLESLFSEHPVQDTDDRRTLSRRADAQFEHQALLLPNVVLSSWWKHPSSNRDSGTSTVWLRSTKVALLELHCKCSPAIAVKRFLERKRHIGHLDHLRRSDDLLTQFIETGALGPLFPESAMTVDTSHPLGADELSMLIRRIQTQLEIPGAAS